MTEIGQEFLQKTEMLIAELARVKADLQNEMSISYAVGEFINGRISTSQLIAVYNAANDRELATTLANYGPGTNTGHGHVWKRPDGCYAKCMGPGHCAECARDLAVYGAATP